MNDDKVEAALEAYDKLHDTANPPHENAAQQGFGSQYSRQAPPPKSESELSALMGELHKLQEQMRGTASQVLESGSDAVIWETRGGLRMLTMITLQVEQRVKHLATE